LKGSSNFGINFSVDSLYQSLWENIKIIPRIEIDTIIYIGNIWQNYSFDFYADSSYNYITFGNFRNDYYTNINVYPLIINGDTTAAYYFIDKIEIIPILNIIGDSTICKGDTTSLIATVGSNVKWAAALQPSIIISTDSVLKVNPLVTTAYLAYNTTDTASFTVNVVNPPGVNFGMDFMLCDGTAIVLDASQASAKYEWQDGSTNPNFLVKQAGTYWVIAKVNDNCKASDTLTISYRNCDYPGVFIPNAITPDGDGQNDVFTINTEVEFSSFKIKIFNRREQQIFESDDAHFRWDATFKGDIVPLGVYLYYIEATDKLSNKQLHFKGTITVLW